MAFAGRFGGLVRQGLYQNSASSVAPMASMLNYVRDMSSKLFVGGLSWGTDDQSLKDAFSTYGEVIEARVITDRDTGRSRNDPKKKKPTTHRDPLPAMALAARSLIKSTTSRIYQIYDLHLLLTLRHQSSLATKQHKYHEETHVYENPNKYIGSWKAPKDPKEAEAKLALLRRDYAKSMKEVRKVYIHEMEVQRLEKERQDLAKKEAMMKANEERRRMKAAAAEVRAAERKVADEQFRQALIKERAEKLENWRTKEQRREAKKKEKNEVLRAQSAAWIEESQLEKKIMEAIVDSTPL